ncbi:MAG: DNA/RNA non-specific endonuclease [Eubacterium sp.]|nr:DNA/RNA non-specific endonuclease [Eubacterium sp.]
MKRLLSLFISLIITLTALQVPSSVFASVFKKTIAAFSFAGYSIPAYDGDDYEVINGGKPKFTSSQINQNIYEKYGALDSLGRVTTCSANIDQSLMPTEPRGSISKVKPTGWVQNNYGFIGSGGWLYNRSHLIGFQLTGENANKNNLMTGTRHFNATGMLPFENEVADYVHAKKSNNVLYRVTPAFSGKNLLAYGVIMEALSVDDNGASVKFCVFIYNVQDGVMIDYATGNNIADGDTVDLSGAYIELSKKQYTYANKAYRPAVKVKVDGFVVDKSYYTVAYSANKNVGTATVTVTGRGVFRGTKRYTFKIVPKSTNITKLTPAKKAATVKWKRNTVQTTGYQVQYSLSPKMKKATTVTDKKNSAASRKITKLKAKSKYYFRIRTYMSVCGKKYYSSWSKVKSAKTK